MSHGTQIDTAPRRNPRVTNLIFFIIITTRATRMDMKSTNYGETLVCVSLVFEGFVIEMANINIKCSEARTTHDNTVCNNLEWAMLFFF
jgi:hypothetical protein